MCRQNGPVTVAFELRRLDSCQSRLLLCKQQSHLFFIFNITKCSAARKYIYIFPALLLVALLQLYATRQYTSWRTQRKRPVHNSSIPYMRGLCQLAQGVTACHVDTSYTLPHVPLVGEHPAVHPDWHIGRFFVFNTPLLIKLIILIDLLSIAGSVWPVPHVTVATRRTGTCSTWV